MKKTLAIILSTLIIFASMPFCVSATDSVVIDDAITDTWDGTFTEPTETDADGNIIINTAEEMAWVALRGGSATIGKNYIVAKGSVFNLNGMTGISANSTVADVKEAGGAKANAYSFEYAWRFESDNNRSTPFGGNFDGNGLIVYNLFSSKGRAAGGLFPVTMTESNGTVTIKNVTVMASHIGGYHYAGGIVGIADAPDTSTKLVIENCAVKNCYIYDNNDTNAACQRTTGTLVGMLSHNTTTINNCLVVDNELSAQGIIGGLFGNSSIYGGANTVSNVISIGTTVQATQVNYTINEKTVTYTNVYTDQIASTDGITTLAVEQMQGAAATVNMNLNWNVNWAVGAEGEYPSIIYGNSSLYDEWDGTLATSFASGSGTKDDPYIIATAEQLAYAALGAETVSNGKYFKVVANATFNLNGMKDITLNSTVEEVMAATTDKNWRPATDTAKTFGGYFDGNGVVIYNMYSGRYAYSGLFSRAYNNNDEKSMYIKNVTLLNSRSNGYHYSGGIVGYVEAPDTARTLNIENCKVLNCWISDNNNTNSACNRTSGIIAGTITHNSTKIKNCFASGNVTSATEISGGIIGNTSAFCPGVSIQNCIVLGSSAYPVVTGSNQKINKHLDVPGTYYGVYSDQDVDAAYNETQIKKVSEVDMKGPAAKNNMPDLDWGTWIAFEGELPDFRASHTLELEQNDNATHKVTCTDCGKAMLETHVFVENAMGTEGTCACGYSAPITERRTDVWDGTYDGNFPAGDGSKDNPYIVKTAENMAYVALKSTPANSAGKYYKVAPNMIFNMNGMAGITLDSTTEDVKNADEGMNWVNDTNKFAGNFDGNGVIIYNIRSGNGKTYAYAALFPNIITDNSDLTVTIKNVTVIASRFKGYHYSAGIIAVANCSSAKQNLVVENCAVKNCFIGDAGNTNTACGRTAAAVIGSCTHNNATINNCLSFNNILEGTDISGGFLGNTSLYGDYSAIRNSVIIGSMPYPQLMPTAAENKVINDNAINIDCFTNVYTDQAVDDSYSGVINTLTIQEISGSNALQNMDLDFYNYWFVNDDIIDLLICHSTFVSICSEDNRAGHVVQCEFCEKTSPVINHTYDKNDLCICGYYCSHNFGINNICTKCGYYNKILDYITYEVIDGEVTITGCDTSISDSFVIPKTIIGYPVTSIGNNAFYECKFLTDIYIPDCVTNIGYEAFRNCNNLTSITIPDSVTSIGDRAFFNCDSLTSIIIPDGVTSIGDYAFYSCNNLTSITIPNSVTSIGDFAFDSCDVLTSINIDDENEHYCDIDGVLFNKEVTILMRYPEGKTESSYIIPNSVINIGDYAFRYCNSLTSITISDGVTIIGNDAFDSCDSLTSITIPNSVTSIGNRAFSNCDSLTSITIPDSVTSIGILAFAWCESLTLINVDNGNEYYCDIDGVLFNKDITTLIHYPVGKTDTSYIIPNSVIIIDDYAFMNCNSLTSVIIGDNVTSIEYTAFNFCINLTSITIPDSVTSIGKFAFDYCRNLSEVYYKGTEEEKAKITIDDYNNDYLTNATWYYNSCIGSATHTYDNDSDLVCNICGFERQEIIISGDVNSDGKLNLRDYGVFVQYFNGWDITFNNAVADVTGDGQINGRDCALLLQYLNGWDVELQ